MEDYLASSLGSNLALDGTCQTHSDCPIFFDCTSEKICVRTPKKCNANCSGNGLCMYYGTYDGTVLKPDECLKGDNMCEAVCNCIDGYHGLICDVDELEFLKRRKVRDNLINILVGVVESSDAAEILATSSNLADISDHLDEVSPESIDRLGDTMFSIIDAAVDLPDVYFDSNPEISNSVSKIATAKYLATVDVSISGSSGSILTVAPTAAPTVISGAQTFKPTAAPEDTFIQDSLDKLGSFAVDKKVVGEASSVTVTNAFRMEATKSSLDSSSGLDMSIPTTLVEKSNKFNTTSVNIGSESDLKSISVIVASIPSKFDLSGSGKSVGVNDTISSSTTRITMPTSMQNCNGESDSSILIDIASESIQEYGYNPNQPDRFVEGKCKKGKPYNITLDCPQGPAFTLCDGKSNTAFKKKCPMGRKLPSCNLKNSPSDISNCTVVKFDSKSVTCKCYPPCPTPNNNNNIGIVVVF